jgi:hypothetical protein
MKKLNIKIQLVNGTTVDAEIDELNQIQDILNSKTPFIFINQSDTDDYVYINISQITIITIKPT